MLEEDIKYLREEMMKTETLQAKEEQNLTEWQVGTMAAVPSCVPTPILLHDRMCLSGLQGGNRFRYSAGLVPGLQIEPT